MFNKSKVKKVIQLFESLKAERKAIKIENALGFGTKVMQLIRSFIGKESEQYTMMHSVIINQSGPNSMGNYFSADEFIELRLKIHGHQFDSIIDSCIESVKNHGLYKLPSDKKNVFGDLDNAMLWTLVGIIATTSFLAGVVVTNYGLGKLIDPNANAEKVRIESAPIQEVGRPKLDLLIKSRSAIKEKSK